MIQRLLLVGVMLGAVWLPGNCAAEENTLSFRDVAQDRGISFQHQNGAVGERHLPETMGSGLAFFDYDNDGDLDLYIVQSGPFPPDRSAAAANRLWQNNGTGFFTEIENAAGADDRGYGQGVLAADLDGDGHTDLYITNWGADAFYRNRGDGSFENVTTAAGLGLDGWSSSAAAADADGDGDLDLYVARYLEYDPLAAVYCGDVESGTRKYCDPTLFEGSDDVLYENLGHGRFKKMETLSEANGKGLGVLWTDLDDDGRADIYVANDLTANALYRNLGDMQFEPVSWLSGAAVNREGKPEAGMGLALGDIDDDGDPDLMVTNFDVETNTVYRNDGALHFEDTSAISGFGSPSFNLLGFGIALTDFYGDGTTDAYITNGHIFVSPRRENMTRPQRDLFLQGNGNGTFTERATPLQSIPLEVGRGLGVADIDNDGDPDLAILNNGGPLQLLENNSPASPWVGVRVLDRLPNREAIGARVTLTEDKIDRVGWVHAGASYQSSSDRRLRFRGLDRSSKNHQIEIRWSDGETVSYPLPESALDRYLTVSRDEGIQLPEGEDRSLQLVWTFVGIALFGLILWGLLRSKMQRSSS